MDKNLLNDYIFKNKIYSTLKFDGTNVGIDENGIMYGRNKLIKPNIKTYLKTPLLEVEKIKVDALKS